MPQAASFGLAFGIVQLGFCWLQFCKCLSLVTALLEKRCPKCGIVKSVDEFCKNRNRTGGIGGHCKQCSRLYYSKEKVKAREQKNPVQKITNSMTGGARDRAKEKSLPFDLDVQYVRSLVTSHCPVLQVELDWSLYQNNGKIPFNRPTLDRIDPSKGYVKGNVWIISSKANRIKSDASHEELKLVTEAVGKAIVNSIEW